MLFRGPAAEQRSPHNSRLLIFSWLFLREQTNPPEMERGGVIKLRRREQFVKELAGTFGFLERRLPSSSAALRCLPLLDASSDIVRRSCRPFTENFSATWFLSAPRAPAPADRRRVSDFSRGTRRCDRRFSRCYFCLFGTLILATLTLHRWTCVGQKSNKLIS